MHASWSSYLPIYLLLTYNIGECHDVVLGWKENVYSKLCKNSFSPLKNLKLYQTFKYIVLVWEQGNIFTCHWRRTFNGLHYMHFFDIFLYRAFIKYCVLFEDFRIHSKLWVHQWPFVTFPRCQCLYNRLHTRTARCLIIIFKNGPISLFPINLRCEIISITELFPNSIPHSNPRSIRPVTPEASSYSASLCLPPDFISAEYSVK